MAELKDLLAKLPDIRAKRVAVTGGKWTATLWPGYPAWVKTDTPWSNPYERPSIAENMSHDDAKFLTDAPTDIDTLLAIIDLLSQPLYVATIVDGVTTDVHRIDPLSDDAPVEKSR